MMRLYPSITKKTKLKEQILIVDSEWNMLKLLYAVLSDQFDLVTKNSSVDALQWLESGNKPALIITEFQLPYLDGASFIRHLKYSGIFNSTPVIVLSHANDIEAKIKNVAFQVGAIISKPFNPSYLIFKINTLLHEYKSAMA
ncbi:MULTISPECIES: response regulator [unclassified Mucilaginibacter]|uniref:response regulator n=1 Tax=unclassified Mucilaginibacter TaxID=2617802 RepID=UPI0031F68114